MNRRLTMYLSKEELIKEIMLVAKTSNASKGKEVIATDNLLLALAFRTQEELIKIARKLYIKVTK